MELFVGLGNGSKRIKWNPLKKTRVMIRTFIDEKMSQKTLLMISHISLTIPSIIYFRINILSIAF